MGLGGERSDHDLCCPGACQDTSSKVTREESQAGDGIHLFAWYRELGAVNEGGFPEPQSRPVERESRLWGVNSAGQCSSPRAGNASCGGGLTKASPSSREGGMSSRLDVEDTPSKIHYFHRRIQLPDYRLKPGVNCKNYECNPVSIISKLLLGVANASDQVPANPRLLYLALRTR